MPSSEPSAVSLPGGASFSERVGQLRVDAHAPLYVQLQQMVRAAIERRILQQDDAIPPERDLAAEYAVSRITVRKAIEGLAKEGLVVRRRGAGTFVAARVDKSFSKLSSFSEDMVARGRVPSSAWVSKSAGLVTPEESMSLGLSPGTPVYRFQRMRFADDVPMAVEYSAIAGHCLPGVDAVGDSLYAALEVTGCRPVRAFSDCAPWPFPPNRRSGWASRSAMPGCSSNGAASWPMAIRSNSPNPIIVATPMTSSPN